MSTLYFFFSFHVLRPVAVMCHNDDDESAVHLNEWMAGGRKGCVKGKPESSKSQKVEASDSPAHSPEIVCSCPHSADPGLQLRQWTD